MCRTKGNESLVTSEQWEEFERFVLGQFSRPSWIHKSSKFYYQTGLLLVNRTSTTNLLQTFSPAQNPKLTCHNKRTCAQHQWYSPLSYQKRNNCLTRAENSEEWCYNFLLRMTKCRFICIQMNFNLTISCTTYLYATSDHNTDSKTLKKKCRT